MTIQEVQKLAAELEANISKLLQDFKAQTGLTVHSVPIVDTATSVTARVKIQL